MNEMEKSMKELKDLTVELQDAIDHHDEHRILDIIGQCRSTLDNISCNV